MLEFHEEILSDGQRSVLRRVGPVAEGLGFYLAGGTAVALRLGHRDSDDFDWFAERPAVEVERLGSVFQERGIPVMPSTIGPGTFHGSMDGVRLTFLEFRYPLLSPPDMWQAYGCRIASLDDLAAMKLSAIVQRGSKKDFIDIHEILVGGSQGSTSSSMEEGRGEGDTAARLHRLLDLYKKKFSLRHTAPVRHALAYFDDAEPEPMPRMRRNVEWVDIKKNLTDLLKRLSE